MQPKGIEFRHFANADELARAAALELHGLLQRHSGPAPFGLALSGGRIAAKFYDGIVDAVRRSPVEWSPVHFFWADERCVPVTDPENSSAIADKHLFQPLSIPSAQIHRIRGDVDHAFAVREAEAELCRLMPLNESGQPVLNLVVLGMGEDGHVASLFPGESKEQIESSAIYRHVRAVKPPPDRVTLGYAPIRAATKVWVLASGTGKQDAFQHLLQKDEALPITRVLLDRSQGIVFQDIAKIEAKF